MNQNKLQNNHQPDDEPPKRDLPLDKQDYFVVEYFDFFTNNGSKKVKVKDLGEKFASINSFFLDYLKEYNIPAGFVKLRDKTSLKFIKHKRFPFLIKILNVVNKKTAEIFDKKEHDFLSLPVFEIHFGHSKDSLISESHLIVFDLCTYEDIKIIYRICSKVNAVLKSYFERRGFYMAEVSCSFGKSEDKIYLVDDFTPQSLKIIPLNKVGKEINPYKFSTSTEIRHYTDHLFNMMST